jgi:hypothetical protein
MAWKKKNIEKRHKLLSSKFQQALISYDHRRENVISLSSKYKGMSSSFVSLLPNRCFHVKLIDGWFAR